MARFSVDLIESKDTGLPSKVSMGFRHLKYLIPWHSQSELHEH